MGRHKVKKGCKVCNHGDRASRENLRARGQTYQSLADRFGISLATLHYHWNTCIDAEYRARLFVGKDKLGDLIDLANSEDKSLLEYLLLMRSILSRQMLDCADRQDANATALIAGRLLGVLERIGNLSGEIRQLAGSTVINNTLVMTSPIYLQLQTRLIQTLAQFPDARDAVVATFREMEAGALPMAKLPAPIVLEATN
jgi:hypothetical protein